MKKILIVDDEPNIVMSLEYTFKKNNFEVFIARDGQEALDTLEQAFKLEPNLRGQAKQDSDFKSLKQNPLFLNLISIDPRVDQSI